MKSIFAYLFIITISTSNAFADKIFKSKNGYYFLVPQNHIVREADLSKSFEDAKETNSENLKNLDEDLSKESIDITVKYTTYIWDKDEKNSGEINMVINAVNEIAFEPENFYTEWCPQYEAYFDAMMPQKKITLHVCQKDIVSNNDLTLNTVKLVYDSMFDNIFQYQYVITKNNHTVNIAGTCKVDNCDKRDEILKDLVLNFRWKQ